MDLDPKSMSSVLSIFSRGPAGSVKVNRPSDYQIFAVEDKIKTEFNAYIDQDISSVVASLMRMGHTPMLLL